MRKQILEIYQKKFDDYFGADSGNGVKLKDKLFQKILLNYFQRMKEQNKN
ncbi:hypothetical protein TTHERM_00348270 (macronuclear) [Tetrahymena thermophila SB210]|uniref:Uncharacterized protein n=1 Tax=Tetrahymena thermophila (strain SB210) TaxID=312017 RepID=I7LWS0_TETTS|nr:hypothetical protein TTHERM_00348270 [Tetrahymena thermophila SB210]EAS02737.1 hypothetical protein TTHERM_00348270 [Tetrahymena thermophila SB210]|eukprot:XP_001022982.1 hypothetical protein TTHERM_00348270 [Tetrahymena thermophila SB210]